jgi:phosphopentomutase
VSRAFLIVMDSVGIGGAPDAESFGDDGADTVGHIAEAAAAGRADGHGRTGPLVVPALARLGLGLAARGATGRVPPGLAADRPAGAYGHAVEVSRGKDTPSGHWELTGAPLDFEWTTFPDTHPCFPPDLIADLVARCDLPGILGDRRESGTAILERLGAEHVRTGRPIVYTSADSVVQIAAHEEAFGLERLYAVCEAARALVPETVGRVIARPFTGDEASGFARTANRRDLAVPPPEPTLLDLWEQAGGQVVSVGKIGDIFAHRGTGRIEKAASDAGLMAIIADEAHAAPDGTLVVANLVEFDAVHGHRRNVAGYAAALEAFDRWLPGFEAALRPGDLAVLTADHGCDPTWPGSDHTREQVPVLAFGPDVPARDLGRLAFADVGQTIAGHLGLAPLAAGTDRLAAA